MCSSKQTFIQFPVSARYYSRCRESRPIRDLLEESGFGVEFRVWHGPRANSNVIQRDKILIKYVNKEKPLCWDLEKARATPPSEQGFQRERRPDWGLGLNSSSLARHAPVRKPLQFPKSRWKGTRPPGPSSQAAWRAWETSVKAAHTQSRATGHRGKVFLAWSVASAQLSPGEVQETRPRADCLQTLRDPK